MFSLGSPWPLALGEPAPFLSFEDPSSQKERGREGQREEEKKVGGEPRQPVRKGKNQGHSQFFGRQKIGHLTAQKISNYWGSLKLIWAVHRVKWTWQFGNVYLVM
jgi:hypothetical protein